MRHKVETFWWNETFLPFSLHIIKRIKSYALTYLKILINKRSDILVSWIIQRLALTFASNSQDSYIISYLEKVINEISHVYDKRLQSDYKIKAHLNWISFPFYKNHLGNTLVNTVFGEHFVKQQAKKGNEKNTFCE